MKTAPMDSKKHICDSGVTEYVNGTPQVRSRDQVTPLQLHTGYQLQTF